MSVTKREVKGKIAGYTITNELYRCDHCHIERNSIEYFIEITHSGTFVGCPICKKKHEIKDD